jgi:FRG domain
VPRAGLITSVEQFMNRILADTVGWPKTHPPWFRGEPEVGFPNALLPRLYRKPPFPNENALLQNFRIMAPSFETGTTTPPRGDTDKWLCLAQHVRLPTRLLDWTENALLAMFFAIEDARPVVWMLDPVELNVRSINRADERGRIRATGEFPITWVRHPGGSNPVAENIAGAWEYDRAGVQLPAAFIPPYVHPRMAAQQSRFTVHGRKKVSLSKLAPSIVRLYRIDPGRRAKLAKDLRMLGVGHASAFPDLDGLAKELTGRHAPSLAPAVT